MPFHECSFGWNGLACLQRAICELSGAPVGHNDLFGNIMTLLLTWVTKSYIFKIWFHWIFKIFLYDCLLVYTYFLPLDGSRLVFMDFYRNRRELIGFDWLGFDQIWKEYLIESVHLSVGLIFRRVFLELSPPHVDSDNYVEPDGKCPDCDLLDRPYHDEYATAYHHGRREDASCADRYHDSCPISLFSIFYLWVVRFFFVGLLHIIYGALETRWGRVSFIITRYLMEITETASSGMNWKWLRIKMMHLKVT